MARANYEKLKQMQGNPNNIRNISILAHVDHGKTSIADLLLASNLIINKRQAGLLRYLDSRPDEQRRGITMKSSTVALCFKKESNNEEFLVNIIDSPGHIDFASEVSAAAKISDGTLIIVDVVEGMCAQTVTALETAVQEKTQMILVLNKMDRLFLEKAMNPEDIYLHVTILLETLNACVADIRYKELSLQFEEFINLEQADDEFCPTLGNVIFGSAIDGWAFRIFDFAQIYSKSLNKNIDELNKCLWGDYYFNKKTKVFSSGAKKANKKTLFVSMILENLLALYENIIITRNEDKIANIIEKLNLKKKCREISSTDKRVQLRAILSEWLPLAETVLTSVVELIPAPTKMSVEKLNHILGKEFYNINNETNTSLIEPFIKSCSTEKNAPVIIYITKIYAIDKVNIFNKEQNKFAAVIDIQAKREAVRKIKQILETKSQFSDIVETVNIDLPHTEQMKVNEIDDIDFIACARIFSGNLKIGDELYLLPSVHNSCPLFFQNFMESEEGISKNVTKIKIEQLFMLLGKDVITVDQSVAGNIIGIGKLKRHMIRTGTLSSVLNCIPLIESKDIAIEPFYKCAIEPKQISDMQALLQGVKLLIQSDSCAQCVLQENGEYVLMTAGHVHLEKCLEDLKKFTKIEFKISSPIIQLRETLVLSTFKTDELYESKALSTLGIKLNINAYPINDELQKFLTANFSLLKKIEFTTDYENVNIKSNNETEKNYKNLYITNVVLQLQEKLQKILLEVDRKWENITVNVMAIGDSKNDCCILINSCKNFVGKSIYHEILANDQMTNLYKTIVNGFQLGIRSGPICDEPMKNILFYINNLEINSELFSSKSNMITGILLKEVKVLMHKNFNVMQPRLMEPMYSARMTINTKLLGKIQNRLDQYRGRITETFLVTKDLSDVEFVVPVLESLDFCNKIRADTQGKINPLLHFSHFELIDQNPYNVPITTEESDEDEIENKNLANILMNEIRKRKGLTVNEKIVAHAEKQRTLNKKK